MRRAPSRWTSTGDGPYMTRSIRATSIMPTWSWSAVSSTGNLPDLRVRVHNFVRGGTMLADGSHARLVYSVSRGTSRAAIAPEHVKRSWLRCLDEYGLDPESNREPAVLSHQEFAARKEQSLELVSFADTEMAHLHRQLAGSGHSIILTDRDGVLLSYYGDPSFKGTAARAGLVPGGLWSERYVGTNGMGTCLAERTPLIVHREQ